MTDKNKNTYSKNNRGQFSVMIYEAYYHSSQPCRQCYIEHIWKIY